jgi:hypothetical protein
MKAEQGSAFLWAVDLCFALFLPAASNSFGKVRRFYVPGMCQIGDTARQFQ